MENVPQSPVRLTTELITSQRDVKAILDLPQVEEKWVATYEAISGKKDGELRFQAEKVLFAQAFAGSKALAKTDKFSWYTSFMELAISGLTLRDGLSYIVPFGNKAVFLPGWKGRLEQINENPTVVHVHQPQVVYDCDIFEYELGEKPRIIQHKRGHRTGKENITHVYLVITFTQGSSLYIMEAPDVINIRNNYSEGYKSYVKLCEKHGKEIGSSFKVPMQGANGSWELPIEPPMWLTDEAQAFKKTLVKRVYNELPKLPKQKWFDERIKVVEKSVDADEVKTQLDNLIAVDTETGEVTNAEVITDAEFEPTAEEVKQRIEALVKAGYIYDEADGILFIKTESFGETNSITEEFLTEIGNEEFASFVEDAKAKAEKTFKDDKVQRDEAEKKKQQQETKVLPTGVPNTYFNNIGHGVNKNEQDNTQKQPAQETDIKALAADPNTGF